MFLETYAWQLTQSVVHIIVFMLLRWILVRLVKRFAKRSERVEHRTGLIIKYIDFATIFLLILGFILIWGVDFRNLGVVMSSIFAVIGIGFFAQWSILSNITSGIIMFFTFPYKIGDLIKIHDKEFPYEGIIEDIKTFHIIIKTVNNEIITYPNTMLLQKGVTVIKPDEIAEYIAEEEDMDENVKEQPID
tara:strand:+ start:281783 stop:282352 length:570 start_codon:yes stop_codon:yes gene_type:complete